MCPRCTTGLLIEDWPQQCFDEAGLVEVQSAHCISCGWVLLGPVTTIHPLVDQPDLIAG